MPLDFTLINSGATSNQVLVVIPASILSANSLGVLAVYQRTNAGITPFFPNSVTGTGLTFVSTTSNVEDDTGATRSRFDTWRTMASSDTGSVITLAFGASVISTLVWHFVQVSGVSTAGSNGASAISQPSTVSGAGNSAITATLASAFASANNGVLAFFGHASAGTMFAGAAPNTIRLSFTTTNAANNACMGSFYTTANLSASTATITANAIYGGAVFEIVAENVASVATAQLWAIPFTVAPFEAVA